MADYTPDQLDAIAPRWRREADTLHDAAEGHYLYVEQKQWLAAEVVRLRAANREQVDLLGRVNAITVERTAEVVRLRATLDRVRALIDEDEEDPHDKSWNDNLRDALNGEAGR